MVRQRLEDLLMAVVALIARLYFLAYSAAANAIVATLLLVWAIAVLWTWPSLKAYWWHPAPVLMLVSLLYVLSRPGPPKDNPHRIYVGLGGMLDKCNDGLIAWIGRIKYYCSPISLVEDPGSYRITGAEIRELIDKELKPGDILLRGYDGYLDGIMIRLSGGGQGPGKYFSHAALYLGELKDPDDRAVAARRLETMDETGAWVPAPENKKNEIRSDKRYYQEGRQMVVHAMTRGVFAEDILTFLRCDYLAVLRLPDEIRLTAADRERDRSLIAELAEDSAAIRDGLMQGEGVLRNEFFKVARLSALGKIGSCYDFQFNDIKTANRFSCSEFVYYCFKSVHCYLGLEPKDHKFMGVLFNRNTITPADIYDAAVSRKKLEIVWTSGSLKQ